MMIWKQTLLIAVLGLLAGASWAGGDRVTDPLQPDLHGTAGESYLQMTTPTKAAVPTGERVEKVTLEFAMDLPVGTTVELWSNEGEGLPWENEGGHLEDRWTLDERTGDLVRFRLTPALWGESALWVRLDPAEESVVLTSDTVQKAERVTMLSPERRRSS